MAPDTNPAPDYNTKTCKQLRAILATRNIKHEEFKIKAQLVTAVNESDARKRKAEEELEREKAKKLKIEYDELLAQAQGRGLEVEGTTSQALRDILQRDDARKRKDGICYLFNNTILTHQVSLIDYDSKHNRFHVQGRQREEFDSLTFALLKMGTLNKSIRKEARATFWSLLKFELKPRVSQNFFDRTYCKPTYVALLDRFLRGLGDDGRFGIRKLWMPHCRCCEDCGLIPQDLTETGFSTFTQVCSMLRGCVALTRLKIAVVEQYFFHGEQKAVEDVLLYGKPLDSQGLRNFQTLLQSLPRLKNVEIVAPNSTDSRHYTSDEVTPFARYAFTGQRPYKLWIVLKAILEQTVLQTASGKVRVTLTTRLSHGEDMDYEQWLIAQDSTSDNSTSCDMSDGSSSGNPEQDV